MKMSRVGMKTFLALVWEFVLVHPIVSHHLRVEVKEPKSRGQKQFKYIFLLQSGVSKTSKM